MKKVNDEDESNKSAKNKQDRELSKNKKEDGELADFQTNGAESLYSSLPAATRRRFVGSSFNQPDPFSNCRARVSSFLLTDLNVQVSRSSSKGCKNCGSLDHIDVKDCFERPSSSRFKGQPASFRKHKTEQSEANHKVALAQNTFTTYVRPKLLLHPKQNPDDNFVPGGGQALKNSWDHKLEAEQKPLEENLQKVEAEQKALEENLELENYLEQLKQVQELKNYLEQHNQVPLENKGNKGESSKCSDVGYKLLLKMGYKGHGGLGKYEQGIHEPIKVTELPKNMSLDDAVEFSKENDKEEEKKKKRNRREEEKKKRNGRGNG